MTLEIPDNLLYTEEHEWFDPETGWMGITDFAQDELGDVVYVELPDVDREVQAMDAFMVVESVKAVSDVYAPVTGRIIEVNESLMDHPEYVNEAPYDDGRMVQLDVDDDPGDLLGPEEYEANIA